jgi:ABC-2 type transport system permease protein
MTHVLHAEPTGLAGPLHASWTSMRDALHAEWTKLRTVPSTLWLLLTAIAVTVGTGALTASVVKCPASCNADVTKLSLTGVEPGQALIVILAVLMMSSEYSTGMIRATLTAMPRRSTVLAAKAAILTGVVLAAGTIAVLGSLLAGQLIMPGNGFTAAHGNAPLSLASGPMLRAGFGSVLYFALIALLSLGAASALRDSALSITVLLGVLYIFPVIGEVILNPHLQHDIARYAPMNAGLAIQATRDLGQLAIGPWAGLGVLAAYAAAALLAGGLALRLRDA